MARITPVARSLILFFLLLTLWLMLSGHYDPLLIFLGLLSAAGVTLISRRMGIVDAEGNRREDRLAVWLDAQKLEYFTENDLRQGTVEGKTPDFLLLQPLLWHGDEYHWVESKASFGEDYIHRKNHRGQVSQYVELYGHGMLVYWYGYLTNLQRKNYVIVDRRELGLE